jgi:cob(I)alamin adenosyltransferase
MSIVTKTGDAGNTRLMFNHEVSKHDPRVDAYGAVDEFTAALGMLRGNPHSPEGLRQWVLTIQKHLIGLMGEISTPVDSVSKYEKAGYGRIAQEHIAEIEVRIQELEEMLGPFTDWSLPGGSEIGALADWARVVCRRAERTVCSLNVTEPLQNKSILVYLNRLSDWLWLEARFLDGADQS